MGFEPTRGDPIGLAGRRLNRSAKVSCAHEARKRAMRIAPVNVAAEARACDSLRPFRKAQSEHSKSYDAPPHAAHRQALRAGGMQNLSYNLCAPWASASAAKSWLRRMGSAGQRSLHSIQAHFPTTASSAQFCLLCYQPEPVPRSLAARLSQLTSRDPCRLQAW